MQILGFNFEKIKAERKSQAQGKLEISSNIDIKDIVQEKLDLVKEQVPIKISFEFSVKYKPEIAEIVLAGSILVLSEKDISKEILKKWKAKKIEESMRIPVFNFIMNKCNLKAMQLEEELTLPTHVPLPRIQQQEQKTYTG